jgi:hypothetical protein
MSIEILERFEHEWTVSFGAWKVGIEQLSNDFLPVTGFRRTSIYVGVTFFDTNFTAYEVVGVVSLGAVLFVALVALVRAKVRRSRNTV